MIEPGIDNQESGGPMSSVDDFHQMVGIVFSRLSEVFPVPRDLDPGVVPPGLVTLEGPGPTGSVAAMFSTAMRWLRSERFISYDGEADAVFLQARLTEKGASALSRVPEGLPVPVGTAIIAAARAGGGPDLVRLVKQGYGVHLGEGLGKVVLGVLFDQWSCNHYPEGGAPLLVHLGCDSGCRC